MLAELTPEPETVTVAIGTSMFDITQMWTPGGCERDASRGSECDRSLCRHVYRRRSGLLPGAHKASEKGWYPALFYADACSPARDCGAADPTRRLHRPPEHEHHNVRPTPATSVSAICCLFPAPITALKGISKFKVIEQIFTPTGHYDVNASINVGRHYWAFDTSAALTYLNPKRGLEVSVAPGIVSNTCSGSVGNGKGVLPVR
jgi:Putative MetA-pathway of phenol degradation